MQVAKKSLMISWLCRLGILVAIVMMSSCIPIPYIQDIPFDKETLIFIEPGVTDRSKIESLLGKPDAERVDTSISFYRKGRTLAILLSQYGLGEIGSDHLLMVRYDSGDLVQSYDVLRLGIIDGHEETCTADKLCIIPASNQRLIVFDRPEMDSEAKLFKENEEHCSVYLYYTDYNFLGSNLIDICPLQEMAHSYAINEEGYLFWRAMPGQVILGANIWQQDLGSCSFKYEFECEPGQIYFIRAHESLGMWKGNNIRFSIEDQDVGRKAIMERRLILR